jgi:four helix bundle protein
MNSVDKNEEYHDKLKRLMDEYAHLVYRLTKKYPQDELYGITSQVRRSSVSVVLNYIEGYARFKNKVYINFLEISYGSLKETMYLLHFSLVERYINHDEYKIADKLANEIAAMLWGIINNKKREA